MVHSTNTTQAIPADVAAWKKLTESQVDKLWEEKVTNASWLMTLTGLRYVDYAWNRSEAAEKDVTVNLFKEKLATYVHSLDKRGLNETETTAPRVYSNDAQRDLDAEHANTANRAEEVFFKEFKTLTSKLNIDIGTEAGVATTQGVLVGLKEFAKTVDTKQKNNLFVKIESSFKNTFCERVFKDAVETFATQSIESLTPENVELKAKSLKKIFSKNELPAVENAIRTAIAAGNNGANKAAMAALSQAYLEVPADGSDNAKVTALADALRVSLAASEVTLKTQLVTLCGTNRNGTINTAYQAMIAAETEKNNKFNAFMTARGEAPANTQDFWAGVDNLAGTLVAPAAITAHAEFKTASTAYTTAKTAYEALMTELNTLAVWTGANITGGTYGKVLADLADVNRVARTRGTELGNFFAHMSADA